MRRLSPFVLALVISLLVVVAGLLHALKQHPPYAPQINSEQQTHAAFEGQKNAQGDSPNAAKANEEYGGKHAGQGEEEGTEFWPPFLGLRLKITDSLLATFTLGLLIFTCLLWRSTDKLWFAGEKQLRLLVETSAAQSRDMQASLEIARMSAQAATEAAYSERAWMSPDGFGTHPIKNLIVNGISYDEAIGITQTWRNTGRSPAIRVNIFSAARVVQTGAPIPTFDPGTSITIEERKGIFGPNISADSEMQFIFGENFANLNAGKVRWIVYSRATYSTVFEPDAVKFSESCIMVEINGGMHLPDGSIGPRITSGPVGPQNTAN
jgi:hypothetical protein